MAWQRIERQATVNSLLITIEKQGPMTFMEAEKFIMNLHMLSRLTANRYLEDLMFQGKLIRIKGDRLEIANRNPGVKKNV
jgi:hypothetical protein